MAYNRVQVQDIDRPQPLRPVQRTFDTFAGAPLPVEDQNKQRLAQALQGFASGLMSLGNAKQDTSKDPRLAEAYRIISSSKDPEVIEGVRTGRFPGADVPHVRALWEQSAGERAARAALNDVRLGVDDGTIPLIDEEGRPVDIQQRITEQAAKYTGIAPNSVPFQKAFQAGVEGASNTLQDAVRGRVAEFNKKRNTTLVERALDDMEGLIAAGADDGKLQEALATRTKLARETVGMLPADVNELFIGRITKMVERNPDAALRLITLNRGQGKDGTQLGSLADTNRDDVKSLIVKINDEQGKRFDVAEEAKAIDEARAKLQSGEPGAFSSVQDKFYTNPFAARDPSKSAQRKISRETLQDRALGTFLQDSNAAYQRQGLDIQNDPAAMETKFRRDWSAFVGANRPQPEWKAAIEDAAVTLSNPASATDPRSVAKIERASTLYQTIYSRSPGYAEDTMGLSPRAKKVLDQYQVYKELGDPPNIAMRRASDYVNNPPPQLTGEEVSDLKKAADSLDMNGWKPGGASGSWWGELGPQNKATVRAQIMEKAKAIAADRKVPVGDVVDLAAKTVIERSVLFNGQLVKPSAYLSNETKPFYEKRVQEVFDANKDILNAMGISKASELSLREEMPGQFRVVDARTGGVVGVPALDNDGNTVGFSELYISAKDIGLIREQHSRDAVVKAVKEAKDAADKQVLSYPSGFVGSPTKAERDEAQRRYDERNPPPPPAPPPAWLGGPRPKSRGLIPPI